MSQGPKTSVTDSLGSREEAKAAFEQVLHELKAVRSNEVIAVNLDIPRAASIVLGAAPRIRVWEPDIEQTFRDFDLEPIRKLRTYALATVYTYLVAQPAPRSVDISVYVEEAVALKQGLMVAAEALAFSGLLVPARVAEIRAGNGHLDLATDLVALAAMFDAHWESLLGKTTVSRAEVTRAAELGARLLAVLGERSHLTRPPTPESIDLRNRAFTLLVRAYDDARRALSFLRWHAHDLDRIAPSLYARRKKKASSPGALPGMATDA